MAVYSYNDEPAAIWRKREKSENKHITIKLTEDQAIEVIDALDGRIQFNGIFTNELAKTPLNSFRIRIIQKLKAGLVTIAK